MWNRFTERARRIVFFAQEEAGYLGEVYVSTEHLLLGLTRENDSVAARILERLDVSLTEIRAEIERHVARGDGRLAQDMQLTPRAKRVIDLSYDEAREFGNNYIGTEHLLLGLIREGEGLAGRTLAKLGVTLESARLETLKLQDEKLPQDADEGNLFERTKSEIDRLRERLGLSTPAQEAAQSVLPGDLGVAQTTEGRTRIEVAVNEHAFEALALAYQAKDAHGYRELEMTSRFFPVPEGTRLKRLAVPAALDPRRGAAALYVRILSGDHEGESGWIFPESFARTGEDDAPFPPGQ